MKKAIALLLILLSSNIVFSAENLDMKQVCKFLEQFSDMLIQNEVDDIDKIIKNEKVKRQLIEFLSKNKVLDYSYTVLNIEKINDEYKIKVQNQLKYKKIEGIGTLDGEYASIFVLSSGFNNYHYIKRTDFFDELYFSLKLSYFFLGSMFIIFPFLFHALKRKNVKWVIIIIVFHLIGVLLYYFLEIKRINKQRVSL